MFSEPFSEGMYYLLFVFFSRTGRESNLADVGIEFNAAVIRANVFFLNFSRTIFPLPLRFQQLYAFLTQVWRESVAMVTR